MIETMLKLLSNELSILQPLSIFSFVIIFAIHPDVRHINIKRALWGGRVYGSYP